jgi:hypothetical protein
LPPTDVQEKRKEEAKAIQSRLTTLIREEETRARVVRTLCVYAGMITETLLEYEEPDVVMEQVFHRISDLLRVEPAEGEDEKELMPLAYALDHDTELGRHLARGTAKKLPNGLDDIHEIAIALVINDLPQWETEGYPKDEMLRLLVEAVIAALTFEMATQDFCDLVIEEFIAEGAATSAQGIVAISAAAGFYFTRAQQLMPLPEDAEAQFTNVMIREAVRHNTPGPKNWEMLAAANDAENYNIPEYLKKLRPEMEEFFELIGLENPLGQAVAAAKAAGRMVAVITVEDVGQIHPSIAKSLAKTGMILGARYRDGESPA